MVVRRPTSTSFTDILRFHRRFLSKTTAERVFGDHGIMSNQYPDRWALLVHKDYQGPAEVLRAIRPLKNPPNRKLSQESKAFNRKVAEDRIMQENYFGHMCSL